MNKIAKDLLILSLSLGLFNVGEAFSVSLETLSNDDKTELKIYQDPNVSDSLRTEDLISQMTLGEKIDLLAGYRDFYLHPCDRLGIPAFKLVDGPLGISSWGLFGKATAFPASLSVAASWNRELAEEVGATYAQELRARGIHFLLAPGVNIYRASKGARNFEYYGEDPFLSAEMVVPFIKSVQDGGVIATIKHYAVNDQEFDRYNVSSEIDDRTLHEIYLPPFKAAVVDAGVKAVMTGYNPVNGVYCTENKELIDILKKDWGFKGILMSDWACTHSINAVTNGLDLEMGSKSWFNRGRLIPLIENGEIPISVIDDKVRRIYGACIEMGFLDRDQKISSIPTFNPEANRMALEAAREGIILLKNDDSILPLKDPKVIAVIGPTALSNVTTDRVHNVSGITYGGGGSSKVHPWYTVSVMEGIMAQFPDSKVLYHEGISNRFKSNLFRRSAFKTKSGGSGFDATYYSVDGAKAMTEAQLALQKEQDKAAGFDSKANQNATNAAKDKGVTGNEVARRVDERIDFGWGGSPHGLNALGNNYEIKWEGYIDVTEDDKLFLLVDAQGGYKLWVDDELLVDAWESQSFHFGETSLNVKKGERKKVILEYRNQRAYPSEIRLGYCYQSEVDFSEPLRLAKEADVVIFAAGLDGAIEFEGRDRPFELPFGQDSLIKEICAVNPNTIVNIIAGGGVEMTDWIDQVPAVIHALYPGQEGGRAIAEIIAGDVNPSAKLPFTIEKQWEDSPAYGNYDETRKERKVYYNEGVFTGYRGYDKKNIEPLFPFGYGLSYTDFEYSDLTVTENKSPKNSIEVSFTIKNIGDRSGAEVAQVYIRDPKSKVDRPLKELKGFEKVELDKGESTKVTINISENDLSYYSTKHKDFYFEKGLFEVWVGSSSKDIKLKESITL